MTKSISANCLRRISLILIIVDECHRGSAKEESRWRRILEYFKSGNTRSA